MISALIAFYAGAPAAVVALYATGAIAPDESLVLLRALAVGLVRGARCAVRGRRGSGLGGTAREATAVSEPPTASFYQSPIERLARFSAPFGGRNHHWS